VWHGDHQEIENMLVLVCKSKQDVQLQKKKKEEKKSITTPEKVDLSHH
jgi:hypothetical protein